MKKIELVRVLAEYLELDQEDQKRLSRTLKHFPEYEEPDNVILYSWVHGLVGREGTKAYVVKSNGKVYELDYGVTRISEGGRVIDNEEGISLIEALTEIDLEPNDIIVIREYCFRDDRDYRDDYYYIKASEVLEKVQRRKKEILEEEL